jgi:hypothetical protein
MSRASSLCLLVLSLAINNSSSAFAQDGTTQGTSQVPVSTSDKSAGEPRCTTTGEVEITITCTYTATRRSASIGRYVPRIVLNRAVLSLEPHEESNMLVELTFTNESAGLISTGHTLYLAIDDDQGRNYVRRPLPDFDFSKLKPGEPRTFSDHLLIGSFLATRYTIHLWIPDPDPSLKFNSEHNFLLSSAGVADVASGLNVLAQFTVAPWKRQHK